jgi:hypothetical protein
MLHLQSTWHLSRLHFTLEGKPKLEFLVPQLFNLQQLDVQISFF